MVKTGLAWWAVDDFSIVLGSLLTTGNPDAGHDLPVRHSDRRHTPSAVAEGPVPACRVDQPAQQLGP